MVVIAIDGVTDGKTLIIHIPVDIAASIHWIPSQTH